jgi:hypothetical protein
MIDTQIIITVKKSRATVPFTGDKIVIDNFYIKSKDSQNVCIHAFVLRAHLQL